MHRLVRASHFFIVPESRAGDFSLPQGRETLERLSPMGRVQLWTLPLSKLLSLSRPQMRPRITSDASCILIRASRERVKEGRRRRRIAKEMGNNLFRLREATLSRPAAPPRAHSPHQQQQQPKSLKLPPPPPRVTSAVVSQLQKGSKLLSHRRRARQNKSAAALALSRVCNHTLG